MEDYFKKNTISFSTFMLCDYSESMCIEISIDEKKGYMNINLGNLYYKISDNIKHIKYILSDQFDKIFNDRYLLGKYKYNVWIKCYKTWWSGFDDPGTINNEYFTLDGAIKYIIDKKLDIDILYK